jgi:hypothetical protein
MPYSILLVSALSWLEGNVLGRMTLQEKCLKWSVVLWMLTSRICIWRASKDADMSSLSKLTELRLAILSSIEHRLKSGESGDLEWEQGWMPAVFP